MDEDLELRLLRLKKMRKLLSSRNRREEGGSLSLEEAVKILRKRLVERGDEVLEAALEQYPELAKTIVLIIAEKIKSGELSGEISGAALMSLFESLGARIRLKTTIKYYKKGEYKSIRDLLK